MAPEPRTELAFRSLSLTLSLNHTETVRDPSMASTKREPHQTDEPEAKKAKVAVAEPPKTKERVVLNPADCDLDFNVEGNGLQGSALHEQGFAYCWSGVRANVGITRGKYCFSCKVVSAQPVDMEDTPLDQQHVCRVGISRGDDTVGNLGETEHSFGFGGTGKFSNSGKFSDYGEKFCVGDTIVCAVNLENKPLAFISFSKNGKWLGTARHFNAGPNGLGVVDSPIRELQWESALFPHVLLKNVVVQLRFSIEDGLVPEEGYKPWASALEDGNAILGPTFPDPQDCELMMMVGLPASGKTTWAEKWVEEHPEKRYVLLGTNLALEQMKVPGLLRKHNYGERFDRLMDRATGIFNTLLSRASRTPRNFIIDQTNVYKNARKRKLKPFANYRKIAVVVFPNPEELKQRAYKRFREMGKEVPAEAVNEMLANYVLPISKDMPGADEYFDQVVFPELNRAESQQYLDEMKANLHSKRDTSSYSHASSVQSYDSPSMRISRESSFQSYNSPSLQSQSTSGTSGHWGNPYPPQPLLSASYGNYSSSGGSLTRSDISYYGSYGGHDHSRRNDFGSRIATPGGASDIYQTHAVGDSYSHPRAESRNFLPGGEADSFFPYGTSVGEPYSRTSSLPGGATDPYRTGAGEPYSRTSSLPGGATDPYRTGVVQPYSITSSVPGGATDPYGTSVVDPYSRTSSFAYNTQSGYTGVPGGPHATLSAPRQSMFPHSTPTSYGSPFGTPIPRPPPYEIFSTGLQRSGRYVPPRPGYY